ncbi:dipeptidase PepV [Weissella cibaria]|uniref:dipeptidase PepV n=1 Tax=Weissella cibaria TaxID=137591 RepID=UPI0011973176|nr:dipeptidase PepV [Weissella cibaria]MCS8562497.1 dipeptidase PepV [Weissella cibaria]MCS8566521.1 dipeptidase PepV [Weissella cibaria]MCS8577051.1 dipeptidase PepV [Weissella cibaria]MCT0001388.1 dipeptidase PepV [Weissella cibaria]MDK9678521.1 dipeptidase PepV [Weissella cibaria]
MTTQWRAEALKYEDALLTDLKEMLAIKSVRDDEAATEDAPLGPGPKEALLKFEEFAKRDGFRVGNYKNLVAYAELGPEDADETVAIIGHLDVMPAGDGWTKNPWSPVIEDGRLYARGASDDKGPSFTAYYAMKMIKDLNLDLKRKLVLVMGIDEESDWTGMDDFFEEYGMPTMGFSPDAEFPIINGEKGNVSIVTRFAGTQGGSLKLVSFSAGSRPNMVPGTAVAVVEAADTAALVSAMDAYLAAEKRVKGEAKVDGNQVTFTFYGKQVHGAMPETGENAGTYLANFLQDQDFGGNAKGFLTFLGTQLHDDTVAEKIGAKTHDDLMHDLSMNVGIQRFTDGEDGFVNANFRYPQNTTAEEIEGHVASSLPAGFDATAKQEGHAQVPHYVPGDDPLVKTLLQVYREQTGLPAGEQVIGGGTFGRLLKRGVAFGAMFEGVPDTMHQADEFYPVSDLTRAMAIFGQSMYELANVED